MTHKPLDVRPASLAGQQSLAGTTFPLVFECGTRDAGLQDAAGWIESRREELLALAEEHGAVLFRGFPFSSE